MLAYQQPPLRLRVRAFHRKIAEAPPKRVWLSIHGDLVRVVGFTTPSALRGLLQGADPRDYRDRSDDV